ncbi:Hypothetical protein HVR_LOCUS100 [uncultured virus]|nr:Hypothetical protein HVR_LOCUS100 [uncultured virus]
MGEDPMENVRRHLQTKYKHLPNDTRRNFIENIINEVRMIVEFCNDDRYTLVTDRYIGFRGENNFGDYNAEVMISEFLTGFLETCLTEEISPIIIRIPPPIYRSSPLHIEGYPDSPRPVHPEEDAEDNQDQTQEDLEDKDQPDEDSEDNQDQLDEDVPEIVQSISEYYPVDELDELDDESDVIDIITDSDEEINNCQSLPPLISVSSDTETYDEDNE